MSGPRFAALFEWELRQAGRSRSLWLILFGLTAAFIWAASSTASLHRTQVAAQAAAVEHQRQWKMQIQQRAKEYAVRASEPVPSWQDPTDAGSFSQFFLLEHSFKPHLPLSPLAAGVSDLLPGRLQVKLATPFGVDASYDFQNPRGLALGQFDLVFAIAYLLPVALLLLFSLNATFERDRGVLRLIAAQPVSPRSWLGARFLAMLTLIVPLTCAAVVLALVIAGAHLGDALLELSVAMLLVATYVLFWCAVIYVAVSSWPRCAPAITSLAIVWAVLLIGVPLAANSVLSWWRPAVPAAEYVDRIRILNDEVQSLDNAIVAAGFRATPALSGHLEAVSNADYATRLSFLAPEIERRMTALRDQVQAARDLQQRAATWAGFVSPPLAVENALSVLAGTDLARHREFEKQTRDYQLELRAFFYPVLHAQVVAPTPRPFPNSYGRYNFTDYHSIPSFRMHDAPATSRIASAMPAIAWMLALAIALTVSATLRLQRWPEDI